MSATERAEFRRIAIVNRGEAAVRLIRAVRELNAESDAGLSTIALYTSPDRGAVFVREADESVDLGEATFVDDADGRRKVRYLDYPALEQALVASRAEAAWVGWGFVAEHAAFADLCRKLDIVFIGPDPEVMRALGDKIGSKRLAEDVGVPVAPWSGGPVESLSDARDIARKLGFPLMVKATAGGGGRGIRRVRAQAELADAFSSARSEALAGFGDATVFLETLVEGARHVEVQILGDGAGTTWALGVRDCTVQRRNQKVIEESPSPALSRSQHREVCDAAVRLGDRIGYRGAGTVEFLYDPAKRQFSFMEVNTRLQVEHPVTECTTGVDLVKLQLHVAGGGRLEGEPPAPRGHAIEVRVNAEDPERGFAPAPGQIELLRLPGGPGLRVDSGFREGDRVAPDFDSMLAKVIAFGRDRNEALARLHRALAEMQLAVRGGASNRGFLLELIDHPDVRSSNVDVGWLDRLAATGAHVTQRHADVALVQAAIDEYEVEFDAEKRQFYATAARGRLRLRSQVGFELELRQHGTRYPLRVHRTGPHGYCVEVGESRIAAECQRIGPFERRLTIGLRTHQILTLGDGLDRLIEVDGISHRVSRDDVGMVRAPAPAVVLSIAVQPGDVIERGDRLAVLEAMKTELPILAPCSGSVRQVMAIPNVQVDGGTPLLVLDPSTRAEEGGAREHLSLEELVQLSLPADGGERCANALENLRRLMLGFDPDPVWKGHLDRELESACQGLSPADPTLLSGEHEILEVFADACALFERRTADSDPVDAEARTMEEYLLLYLRSLDTEAAGVSSTFVERLRRVLAHYGVRDLERTRELDEALLWACKAHARLDEQVGTVLTILMRRLDHADDLADEVTPELRGLLDRIVSATRGRHQAVSDLAREVRYRYFDRPFFEQIQSQVYVNAEAQLAAAAREIPGRSLEQRMRALVSCPQPLAPLLASRFGSQPDALRELSLEILLRRYYRIRSLDKVRTDSEGGHSVASAEYDHSDGVRISVAAAHADWDDLENAWSKLARWAEGENPKHEIAIDLFVWREGGHGDASETAEALRTQLSAHPLGRPVRRVVAVVATHGTGRGMSALQHFTFRPGDGGFVEERVSRGLHPMMGKRLQLWRLSNFQVERLPSTEDVYLFHGVAHANPKDERLFAFAEVRDLTPMRNEQGAIVSLPDLERQYLEALAAIRLFQSRRSARRRLHWNRVVLYVWPPMELAMDEVHAIAHRLLPAAEGLGLQKTVLRARMPDSESGQLRDSVIQVGSPSGRNVVMRVAPVADRPIEPLSEYGQRVVRMRQRGLVHPYELIEMLTPSDDSRTDLPPGEFEELDLDENGDLVPVERPRGGNRANLVVGKIRNFTPKYVEGMTRVLLVGDPSREMGSFAEPECRRIIAAVDLAEELSVPLEWFPVSAGAKIAMDSGTENLDWTAQALRRLVEFTQDGGEVNVVVAGINVGGQSYWNAEATMLMHNRGILVMTPEASMVLTGKKALDYSGGVSAEDHQGIGGYERIMGVNGEAQYWARDLGDACRILFRYYEHAYVAPGEAFARRAPTDDPSDRDVTLHAYGNGEDLPFETLGEIFSDERNPGRHKPFDIRRVMGAVVDCDRDPLERWKDMREAEVAVVWDAHLGGIPVSLIGLESQNVTRLGFVPADGPEAWTAGTLFPLSSKKVARAINAASGSRPVVVLANLSGFDGSPESLRRLQLEYGAEIGRAVVNSRSPIVFCVVSRYHGGAYVVFSRRLNERVEVAALEGSYASVIGGAPAAAVVFAGDVDRRTRADSRLQELDGEIAAAGDATRGRLRARWHELYESIHSEKLGEVADEFDRTHDVHRAQRVGSLDHVVEPGRLREYLIEAVERGLQRGTRKPAS
jgi:acetyl/propionyl-CoA carboxylase alpha subunit/acetyl-CoA carboxylase carboxyltransferase component